MHDAPPDVEANLIQTVGKASGRSSSSIVRVEVSHLPSLLVDVQLPPTYPVLAPPTSVEVKSSQSWLSDSLCERLRMIIDDMSREQQEIGEGILVRILDLVLSGDVLHSLSLYHMDDSDATLVIAHATPHLLAPLLSAYDRSRELAQFSQTSFECNICLESKKGSKCFALSCNHVFCQECLRDFWGLHIKEGDVEKVACANAECVKAKRQVGEAEVRMVMSDAEVLRWKWLKLKKAVENGEPASLRR